METVILSKLATKKKPGRGQDAKPREKKILNKHGTFKKSCLVGKRVESMVGENVALGSLAETSPKGREYGGGCQGHQATYYDSEKRGVKKGMSLRQELKKTSSFPLSPRSGGGLNG